ncbi:MAG TPA: ribonuclease H-like domain-containing protein [Fimbriimonas sp.]
MLENTFSHIPGVGFVTERSLWKQGCTSWRCWLDDLDRYGCGQADRAEVREVLEKSVDCLERKEHRFFHYMLGQKEAWRAYPEFRDSCVYLDIETDGGSSGDSVTTIGMWDGSEFQVLIKGRDLDRFPEIIANYRMVVTFFGTGFDLPMLQKRYRGLRFDQIHMDLCPTLRRLGLRGGLKKIEKQLNISRGDETDGLGGLDAIRLWRRYSMLRDEKALETLVAYNREDVVNLETLAEYAYRGLRRETFESCLVGA